MKLRITLFATLLVLLSACFTGCKKELKDFSFSYSMESVDNYKLMVLFDSDKTFRIEEYNYYMDNFAKKRDPKIMEGTLTDEEFASLKPILQKCNFFKMKDSYGFEEGISCIRFHLPRKVRRNLSLSVIAIPDNFPLLS